MHIIFHRGLDVGADFMNLPLFQDHAPLWRRWLRSLLIFHIMNNQPGRLRKIVIMAETSTAQTFLVKLTKKPFS